MDSSNTFQCGICLAQKKSWYKAYFKDCMSKKHYCCKTCLKNYIKEKFRGGYTSIYCPYPKCTSLVSESRLKSCITKTMMSKYLKIQISTENPNYRDCPRCGTEMKFGETEMVMACSKCGCFSCFKHGEAHKDRPCTEYVNHEDVLSTALIKRACKPCPGCSVATEKIDGCNHMVSKETLYVNLFT